MNRLLANLNVNVERMKSNLWASRGLVFSQPVLLALVAGGMSRDDAYRVVQRNAMQSWEEDKDFRQLLESDPDVTLDRDALDGAFDLTRSLRNLDRVSRRDHVALTASAGLGRPATSQSLRLIPARESTEASTPTSRQVV